MEKINKNGVVVIIALAVVDFMFDYDLDVEKLFPRLLSSI